MDKGNNSNITNINQEDKEYVYFDVSATQPVTPGVINNYEESSFDRFVKRMYYEGKISTQTEVKILRELFLLHKSSIIQQNENNNNNNNNNSNNDNNNINFMNNNNKSNNYNIINDNNNNNNNNNNNRSLSWGINNIYSTNTVYQQPNNFNININNNNNNNQELVPLSELMEGMDVKVDIKSNLQSETQNGYYTEFALLHETDFTINFQFPEKESSLMSVVEYGLVDVGSLFQEDHVQYKVLYINVLKDVDNYSTRFEISKYLSKMSTVYFNVFHYPMKKYVVDRIRISINEDKYVSIIHINTNNVNFKTIYEKIK